MTAALLILAAVAAPLPGHFLCDSPQDARPIIEVAAKGLRMPLSFYVIGFSKFGRLAWLERRRGFDSVEFDWTLHVQELGRDHQVAERSFSLKAGGLDALCGKHGKTIARLLEKQDIDTGRSPGLEQPTPTTDPTSVDLRSGRRDPEANKIRYDVILRGQQGQKLVGTVWRVGGDSGEDPVEAPRLLGIVRSPFEPRVAVLVTQQMIGTEGVSITLVNVFGGRLDEGWSPTSSSGSRGTKGPIPSGQPRYRCSATYCDDQGHCVGPSPPNCIP